MVVQFGDHFVRQPGDLAVIERRRQHGILIALLFLGLLDGPMAWIQSQLWRFLGWSTSFVEILLGLGRAAGTAV